LRASAASERRSARSSPRTRSSTWNRRSRASPASTRRSRTRSSTTTCPTIAACSMRSSASSTTDQERTMALEFKLPDVGEGVAEGEIVKWLVKVGDGVKEHQAIVEVMTDKATVEIPAPAAGKITAIKAKEGQTRAEERR